MYIFLHEFKPMMDEVVCTGISFNPYTGVAFPGWIGACAAAILASGALIALIYLIGAIFQSQPLLANMKIEVYELVVTVAIFLVLLMLIGGMCSVKSEMVFPGDTWGQKSIYYSATNHLFSFAEYTLQTMFVQYKIYTFIDYLTSTEISAVPMGIGANMRPLAGLGGAVKPVLNNAFTVETIAVVTAEAQAYVLDYGTYAFLYYFLPFGLVLRCFTYTRPLGGTIIALTCVFLFIYPLLVIPCYDIAETQLKNRLDFITRFFASNPDSNPLITPFSLLFSYFTKWFWSPDLLMLYALIAMPSIAIIFIGGVFMPLFITLVAITTARYLSKSMGEEIDITNLTRMI
ncbi:MAG: hypothetical protein PHS02_00820 [Candidatus ainarchaeum sp.]|nr:hypothetical protein [Candidatus ainarchaeum sp.]